MSEDLEIELQRARSELANLTRKANELRRDMSKSTLHTLDRRVSSLAWAIQRIKFRQTNMEGRLRKLEKSSWIRLSEWSQSLFNRYLRGS